MMDVFGELKAGELWKKNIYQKLWLNAKCNLMKEWIKGGTELSFWYECAARRVEYRGLDWIAAKFWVSKEWFLELKFEQILGF